MDTDPQGYRIGEIASAAGVTVRTLHHYDEIGLLTASSRTEAGHRIYTDDDLAALYRIAMLRRLGLSLDEVKAALNDPEWDLASTLQTHLAATEARLAAGARLRSHLSVLLSQLDHPDHTGHRFIEVLHDMTAFDNPVRQRISILVYQDLEAGFEFLQHVFGLGPGTIEHDGDGHPVHASLEAGDGVVWLHPETSEFKLASPRTLGAATATMAIMVDDVDAHHALASERGAEIVYPPVDQPYGYREYSARDHEGGLWSFMKALD
ncbi:MAG: MerR family transcriptional regulator [Acidimicrobiales bacterium]